MDLTKLKVYYVNCPTGFSDSESSSPPSPNLVMWTPLAASNPKASLGPHTVIIVPFGYEDREVLNLIKVHVRAKVLGLVPRVGSLLAEEGHHSILWPTYLAGRETVKQVAWDISASEGVLCHLNFTLRAAVSLQLLWVGSLRLIRHRPSRTYLKITQPWRHQLLPSKPCFLRKSFPFTLFGPFFVYSSKFLHISLYYNIYAASNYDLMAHTHLDKIKLCQCKTTD